MLTIYKARTVHAGAEKVLSEIGAKEGRHVVIVPDPFTLAVEGALSDKLGEKGIFDVEVMSFSRLASVVLGGKIKKCLSPAGSVMLMEKVISEKEPELIYYRRAARKAGFAAEVYAAITSIRNSGVTAERLALAAEDLQGYVKEKTKDLALLYKAYLEELNLRHTDSTTRLEALVKEIRESETFGDVNVHIVDHADLNAKQLEVVAALVEKARSVTVAVAVGEGEENARIYPALLSRLRRLTEGKMREIDLPLELTGEKETIVKELFSYSFRGGKSDGLSLLEAKDMTEEIVCLATEITRLVREEGLRYADVAVITPSFLEYLPHIERIFKRYRIPLFSDARYPLSECDVFRHIVRAAELVVGGFDASLVRGYLSHELFLTVSEEEKAAFCDYVDKSGVDHGGFLSPFVLYENDPLFAPAEKVRQALLEELGGLISLPKEGTVSSYVAAMIEFLRRNDMDGRIAEYIKKVRDAGLIKQAEIVRQAPAATMELLSTLEDLRGEEKVTLAGFLLALLSGAGQIKIAALPVSLDCVYFAPVEQAMYAPIGALFVLGAEEGLFPLEKVKEGILGSVEYAAWQNCGVEIKIENVGVEELAASRFHVLQVLLRGERTYLSHLGGRAPSPCMSQLSEIFGVKVRKCEARLEEYEAGILIPTKEVAEDKLAEYSRRSREGLLGEKERRFAQAIAVSLGKSFPLPYVEDRPIEIDKEKASRLFFGNGSVSVSEIEQYFRCPFVHFVKNGLRAKEKPKADHDARDIGILAHECMEIFVRRYVMKRRRGSISDEEAREIASGIAREEIERNARYRAIEARDGKRVTEREVKRCGEIAVAVKNQIYSSEFIPSFFEIAFGEGGSGLVAPTLGGVPFRGRIDRVDLLPEGRFGEGKRYAVALDYKTGSNQIDPKQLFYGEKVQLPLYLEVLSASGYLPVAALYASLSDQTTKKPQYLFGPKWENEGLLLCLDDSFDEGYSPYTGLSRGKEGEIKGTLLVTKEELDAMSRYAVILAEGAIGEIREGYVRPSPLKSGWKSQCEYCELRAVCRHAKETIRDVTGGKADAAKILEIVRKEEKDGDA